MQKGHLGKGDIELLGERINVARIRNAAVRHAHCPVANDNAALPYLLGGYDRACITALVWSLVQLVLKEMVRHAHAARGGPTQGGHRGEGTRWIVRLSTT